MYAHILYSHCHSMAAKGIEDIGGTREVKNHGGWPRMLYISNLLRVTNMHHFSILFQGLINRNGTQGKSESV